MRYALIDNNVVTNIIVLSGTNIQDFPNAILIKNIPVKIGDEYKDNFFYREDKKVLTELEEMELLIIELDTALLDSTYQNIMGSIE